jgi:hypothetical protein
MRGRRGEVDRDDFPSALASGRLQQGNGANGGSDGRNAEIFESGC